MCQARVSRPRVFVIAEPILRAQTSLTRIETSGNDNFRKHK